MSAEDKVRIVSTTESPADPRRWFYILPQTDDGARYSFAARLTEKAWLEGHRVGLQVDDAAQADVVDTFLWQFAPESFLPHSVVPDNSVICPDPIGVLCCDPSPRDWDTLIVLGSRLPSMAEQFQRLALVAHNDQATLTRARDLFRQLRELGCEPRVHDARRPARGRPGSPR